MAQPAILERGLTYPGRYAETVLQTPNLIGYWPLWERFGTRCMDLGPNHFDGTYSGSPTLAAFGWVDGHSGVTLASGKYVNMTDRDAFSLSITNSLSYEAWIYPTSSAAAGVIFGKGSGSGNFEYVVDYGGSFASGAASLNMVHWTTTGTNRSQVTTTAGTVPVNVWTHFVAVATEASTVGFYINGVLSASNTTWSGTAPGNQSSELDIGRRPDNNFPFIGTITGASMYSRALTVNEAAAHYNAGLGR